MSNYKKHIRFKFFTIEKNEKEQSKYLNITDWVSRFKREKGFKKIHEVNGLKYSVREPHCKSKKRWYFRITRARENDGAVIIANDDYKDIPLADNEYLGEDMQFLYDTEYNIAMIQSSMFTISITELEEILNDTFGYKYGSKEYIEIKPIMSKESLDDYKGKVKAIELSIGNKGIVVPEGKSSFTEMFKLFNNKSTNRLKIDFSTLGEKRNEDGKTEEFYIEKNDIEELSEFIRQNDHAITVGRAKVKLASDKNQQVIDLIGGVTNVVIPFTIEKKKSLGFILAIKEMDKKYGEVKHKISKLIPSTNSN